MAVTSLGSNQAPGAVTYLPQSQKPAETPEESAGSLGKDAYVPAKHPKAMATGAVLSVTGVALVAAGMAVGNSGLGLRQAGAFTLFSGLATMLGAKVIK